MKDMDMEVEDEIFVLWTEISARLSQLAACARALPLEQRKQLLQDVEYTFMEDVEDLADDIRTAIDSERYQQAMRR